MNLIDAIKSSRLVRDPTSTDDDYRFWHKPMDRTYPPYMIVRDTWEIQEPTVTITRAQFWEAYAHAPGDETPAMYECVQFLARKLGLEDPSNLD